MMRILTAISALSVFGLAINLPPVYAQDAQKASAAFCETAATAGNFKEKDKFMAWCEAETLTAVENTAPQAENEPPGVETGVAGESMAANPETGVDISQIFGNVGRGIGMAASNIGRSISQFGRPPVHGAIPPR
jgi:hypothetical protein